MTNSPVFNNTIVDCAYGLGFEVYAPVLFKNNIFHNNGGMIRGSDAADARNCTFTYNNIYPDWEGKGSTDISADPLLVGPFTPLDLESEDPKFVPDFSRAEVCQLQAGSPCIDAGTHLVQTVGSGTGTEIVVQDAEYFTDGFDIAEGDAIRIGTNSLVRILEVDYDHNIITVDRSISWDDGDGVGLYYYSSAPDIGAYEFAPTLTLHGAPADQAIHLAWTVNTTLPVTSTWRIDYRSQTGTLHTPITGIISPTRAYTLTGLTNYTCYTVTLNGMLDSTPFLTDTVKVMPTDRFLYLPLVMRNF